MNGERPQLSVVIFDSIVNIQINEKPKSILVGTGAKGQRYDRLYKRTLSLSLAPALNTFISGTAKAVY